MLPAAVCTSKAEALKLCVQAVSWQKPIGDVHLCLTPPGGLTCQNSSGGELHAADQLSGTLCCSPASEPTCTYDVI